MAKDNPDKPKPGEEPLEDKAHEDLGQPDKVTLEKGRGRDPKIQSVHSQLMREKSEPTEGLTPVPMFLMALFALLFAWGGFYMAEYNGNWRPDIYDHTWTAGGGEPPPQVDWENDVDALMARGKRIFNGQCASCHQSDGLGVAGQYPPLVDSRWVEGPKEKVISILLNGLAGPIEVKGNVYNGNMPEFKDTLSSRDIAAVLTYVRNEWGNEADYVAPSEVDTMRDDSTTDRSAPWSAEELLELYPWE